MARARREATLADSDAGRRLSLDILEHHGKLLRAEYRMRFDDERRSFEDVAAHPPQDEQSANE
jgi:hypothetical protein